MSCNIFKRKEKKKNIKISKTKILKAPGHRDYFRINADEKELPSGGSIYSGLTEPSLSV